MIMNKRLLFICHLPFPVHGSSMVGQYIKESKIINSSFNTAFINLSTSRTVDEIGKNPIPKLSRYIQIIIKVIIKLISFNPEIVYISINAKGLGFFKDFPIAWIAKFFGKKLVLHYHNKGVNSKQNLFYYDILYRYLFKNTKVILLSKRLYDDIKKYVDKKNIYYCPNGIPYPDFESKILNNSNEKIPRILFLSNLLESKGVYILLKALKILNDKGIEFQCNFVGGEGDISAAELNLKISLFNLKHCVSYLGRKYDEDKYEIFVSSDIFVFPTHYHNECFPLVILEAMMFGLPIITTSEGGISDMVQDGETGFIVQKQDPEKLAEKILILINNPGKCKLMAANGNEKFYKNYTLDIFEKRLTKILTLI